MSHEVLNQPPPFVDVDLLGTDAALAAGLDREGGAWADAELRTLGRLATSETTQTWARRANASPPVLHTHDRV